MSRKIAHNGRCSFSRRKSSARIRRGGNAASAAEDALTGGYLGDDALAAAAAKAADGQDMLSDLVASADYRTHLCGVILKRAVSNAAERV